MVTNIERHFLIICQQTLPVWGSGRGDAEQHPALRDATQCAWLVLLPSLLFDLLDKKKITFSFFTPSSFLSPCQWTGVLIEANPITYQGIRERHRK